VAGSAQLVGESEESVRLSLCVVEQEDLGHWCHSNHGAISIGGQTYSLAGATRWAKTQS